MSSYDKILNREEIKRDIIQKLNDFESNKHDIKNYKRGFYISGDPGSGKTHFITALLKELNYDILHYTASDVRNKTTIEKLTNDNMSSVNVISMFHKKKKKLAIVMDEIDGLNNGDKGGISALISIIRQKKTKKQQNEIISNNAIFCISTNEIDKKLKELINVTHHYKLQKPNTFQMKSIISTSCPDVSNEIHDYVVTLSQNDLNKFHSLYRLYMKNQSHFVDIVTREVFSKKSITELSKDVVRTFLHENIPMNMYQQNMNENDRTIIALLWHENVCDVLENINTVKNLHVYGKILDNICYGDYVDRITFQKQIWQFNELSSYIKIMYNNYLIHNVYKNVKKIPLKEIRFTKVLTKYSTEYNNYTFFQSISNTLMIDKKDLICYFQHVKENHLEDSVTMTHNITTQDISRIYRYMDQYENV